MAIDNSVVYPGQSAAPDANYPQGSARNITVPSDGTGFPLEQVWVRDIQGLLQKILLDGSITPSGNADTVLASDYLDGLQVLFVNRSELSSEGGDVLEVGNRLTAGHRDGLVTTRDSGSLMTAAAGSVRNAGDTADLILPAALQKDITAAWAVGDGNGGLAEGLVPVTQDMYRTFIGSKPDGTSTLFWDTSPTAANFFAGANAIAAGYSDATLFRRFRWTYVDGTLAMPDHTNSVDDPSRYDWKISTEEFRTSVLTSVSRTAHVLEFVPPDTVGDFLIYLNEVGTARTILITSAEQTDQATDGFINTMQVGPESGSGNVKGLWKVDSAQQIFSRSNGTTATTFAIQTVGWRDYGVLP